MDKIKVLIADDHAIVRMGLTALLNAQPNMEVVGEARNGDLAVKAALRLKPDVVIMDLLMPVKDGVAATGEIRAALPGTNVLVLTTSTSADELAGALDAGATGVIPKTTSNTTLLAAIVRGLTNTEIARQFGISENTVRKATSAIFTKLGVNNRTEATALALRKNLLKT